MKKIKDVVRFGPYQVAFWGPNMPPEMNEGRRDNISVAEAVAATEPGEHVQFIFPSGGDVVWHEGTYTEDGAPILASDSVYARGQVPPGFVEDVRTELRKQGR